MPQPLRISILGTRGIPNRYGGFEAFAEELSKRLCDRGHHVRVYCRKPFTSPDDIYDPRVRRIILPTLSTKHLDTPLATFLQTMHVLFTDTQVVLMCNVANSPLAWIPRLFGKPLVLNVDGLDRKRKKWGWLATAVLSLCELLSTFTPTRVVTDAATIRDYYRRRYGKDSAMIGYGAAVPAAGDDSLLSRYGLQPRRYLLYVSRLEKENNPELVLEAYRQIKTDWPLVMVGSNVYDESYVARLRFLAPPNTIFTGPVYGAGYWTLQKNAGAFVFACEVGGIHPALVETMAAGNASLYLDTESNRETAGSAGIAFQPDAAGLAAKMSQLVNDASLRQDLGRRAAARAQELYSWDEVTRKYEELLTEVVGNSRK